LHHLRRLGEEGLLLGLGFAGIALGIIGLGGLFARLPFVSLLGLVLLGLGFRQMQRSQQLARLPW